MKNTLSPKTLWCIKISVKEPFIGMFEEIITNQCVSISYFRRQKTDFWQIEGITESEPSYEYLVNHIKIKAQELKINIPTVNIDILNPLDWLANTFSNFIPIHIGRLSIWGDNYASCHGKVYADILINAGTAFGSGKHPTTGLCLHALEKLAKKHKLNRILDLGCGSGIIGIASAKFLKAQVLAIDIDPEAIRVTRYNSKKNNVHHLVKSVEGSSDSLYRLRNRGPYDLIISNLFTNPLLQISKVLTKKLSYNGFIILSGFLTKDCNRLLNAYCSGRLKLLYKHFLDDWAVIVLKKSYKTKTI